MSDTSGRTGFQRGMARMKHAVQRILSTPEPVGDWRLWPEGWRLLRVECTPALTDEILAPLLSSFRDARAIELVGEADHPELPSIVGKAREAGATVRIVASEPREVPEGAELVVRAVIGPADEDRLEQIVTDAARAGATEVRFRPGPGARECRTLFRALEHAKKFATGLEVAVSAFSEEVVERPVCEADPRDSLTILADGTIAPCGELAGRVTYGNIGDRTLEEVREDAAFRERCDGFHMRLQAREKRFFNTIMGTRGGYEKAIRETSEWMPEPPEGCRGCPWLSDHMGREIIG